MSPGYNYHEATASGVLNSSIYQTRRNRSGDSTLHAVLGNRIIAQHALAERVSITNLLKCESSLASTLLPSRGAIKGSSLSNTRDSVRESIHLRFA